MTTPPFAGTQNSAYGTLQLLTLSAVSPPPLTSRSRIGVAALSGVVDETALAQGLAALEEAGFEVVQAPNLASEDGLFAGTDEERLAGLHELAADRSIEAILFARGGHGVLRLLPAIDWKLLAERPRWFVGYSDLTPFLAQVVHRLGWVALHGPMVAADPPLDSLELGWLKTAMSGVWPSEVELAGMEGDWRGVEGALVGGCLSLLSSTLGTEWFVPTDSSILFLEDTHEPLYRVDRMLQQLKLSGSLDRVRGIVLGSFETASGGAHEAPSVVAAARDAAGESTPIAWGCLSGHCRPNATIALGASARLESTPQRLVLTAG